MSIDRCLLLLFAVVVVGFDFLFVVAAAALLHFLVCQHVLAGSQIQQVFDPVPRVCAK